MRSFSLLAALAVVCTACSGSGGSSTTTTSAVASGPALLADGSTVPPAPEVPDGPLDPETAADLDLVFGSLLTGIELDALERLGESGDARIAWLLADLLRFFQVGEVAEITVASFENVTGTEVEGFGISWGVVTDRLIAWGIPAPPGYIEWKRIPFELIEPDWEPFFGDPDADVDWRHVSWGGVLIDDRAIDAVHRPCRQSCIPALDDPLVTDAAGGDWYPDDRIVFGLVVNGAARAYPKNIMEVHEMVNDDLGGVRVGMPYCTLCGSAQAYVTDAVPAGFETLELRTSGLLNRSNKVMFDLHTFSMFDTFLGTAVTGPLQDAAFALEPVTVFTSTWGDWKAAHPETTIVAEDGGLGRTYPLDPLRGRDDDGPIFPVGGVDARLPVQEPVLGVEAADGSFVAFPVAAAAQALTAGETVEFAGILVVSDGAGLSAQTSDGSPVSSHQAFWFAWSQFHPDTLVWSPGLG